MLQMTVSEHQASPYADRPCARCHMPLVPGPSGEHRSHAFSSPRDPTSLREAVVLDVAREGHALWVTARLDGVGHALPTGDLFRRIEISAEALGADMAVVSRETRHLARHFGRVRGPAGLEVRVDESDDRLTPGVVSTMLLDLGEDAEALTIAYRISYQRALFVKDGAENEAEVFDEVVLAEGLLPAAIPTTP